MIKINDLRTGNILSYKTDEGDMYAPIDWQDLKWLTENSVNFNLAHSAIPLTQDILFNFGFVFNDAKGIHNRYIKSWGAFYFELLEQGKQNLYHLRFSNGKNSQQVGLGLFSTLHELQNTFFAITGEELNTTKLTNP